MKIIEIMELLLSVDDLCLRANNIIDLQEKINILYEYCNENRLEVNVDKTKILVCSKSGKKMKHRTIYYGTTNIALKYTC